MPTASPPLNVLIVGNTSHADFAGLMPPLEGTAIVNHAASAIDACSLLAQAPTLPDLILLVQARPGEIQQAEVDQLQRAAPLVPQLAILGSCCEGETRTGRSWPGVPRCLWYQWPARWRAEQLRRERGQLPLWSLPATLSEEERLLVRLDPERPFHGELVGIVAPTAEARSTLADALVAIGCRVAEKTEVPSLLLWDTSPARLGDPRTLADLRTRHGAVPIVALLNFPRHQDYSQIRPTGVSAILPKPLLLDELTDAIRHVL